MSDTPKTFEYLLNAMEDAARASNPAEQGYAGKRSQVLQYVADLFSDYLRRHNDACDAEDCIRQIERAIAARKR